MAERIKHLRELLIEEGIKEINAHGLTEFSVRRISTACGVSCAAPYKHFKDKRDFIASIIDYVNELWHAHQQIILSRCSGSLREQIVEVSVNYLRFLMENPHLRTILMLKDQDFDNLYHKTQGQLISTAQQLQEDYFGSVGLSEADARRKLHLVRAMLFGSVFVFDSGEIPYSEEALAHFRQIIDREFDLP